MADLSYTPEELQEKRRKMGDHAPDIGDMEKYPWGTRLRLDHDTITKIGLNAQIGQEVTFTAKAKVVEMEANEEADGDVRQHVGLQLVTMDMDEAGGVNRQTQANILYANGNKGE